MRLALILSDYGERMRELQRNLSGEFSVIIGRSVAESLDLLQTLPVDVVLVDLDSDSARGEELPERIREIRPHCTVVGVLPREGEAQAGPRGCDASLRADSTPYEISMALAGAMERQRLLDELDQQRAEIRRLQARSERLQAARPSPQPVDKILKAFSRALSSGFDQERLLNLFADTVLEMMRVSKVSVLLHDAPTGVYRVRCNRGLRPDVAEGLCLRGTGGLAAWLGREGRIMRRDLADGQGALGDVRKEMDALQATVSIPMLCTGMLVGVLNLNSRVTGSPFEDDELETLFTMASHMAVALQDVGILSQMQHQKAYVEQILEHLSAGVVTIDEREQVVTLNRRAGEILGRAPADVLRRDLRRLPSPLGDMLYETMRTGRRYQAEEILLVQGRVPLLVNTYRLEGPEGLVLGSAAVFDARPPQRATEEDHLSLLQPSLDKLAADVAEPARRLKEFTDRLASDETHDPECRASARALQIELRRLQSAAGKLAALAGRLEYRFEPRLLAEVVQRGLAEAHAQGVPDHAAVLARGDGASEVEVHADAEHLPRALSCLLAYAVEHSAGNGPVEIGMAGAAAAKGAVAVPAGASVSISYQERLGRSALERAGAAPLGEGELPDLELSVGRRIIEDHGGTVAIGAEPDGATSITVRFPSVVAVRDAFVVAAGS